MGEDYDILIVGGGMVGASLAAALTPLALRIAVVEAWPPASRAQPSYDDRSTAVAQGSRRIFDAMGCWRALAGDATPIERIHVSDRGRFGFTRIVAKEVGAEALGYVVENRLMGQALWQRLRAADSVDLLCPARVTGLDVQPDRVLVDVERDGADGITLRTALVVAADGARSPIRAQLGIGTWSHDYEQTALIANVTSCAPHRNEAFERFTDDGPLAMLPLSEGRCSLVWTLPPDAASRIAALSEADFLAALQSAFGYRLGRLTRVGQRNSYPLRLVRANRQFVGRVLLIGNAAHSLHPVAGQGFNLGLRDVASLADVLADAVAAGDDPGSPAVLERYRAWREEDHERVVSFTDSLVRLFTNPLGAVKAARGLGLLGLDLLPGAKMRFARQSMGLSGRLPRLARGIALT
jgi:2-octaprenyl-6-methoxyphenol hydroxylase